LSWRWWPQASPIKDWSLTSLQERLIKIGAKVRKPRRYVAFQKIAEIAGERMKLEPHRVGLSFSVSRRRGAADRTKIKSPWE